MTKTEKEIKPPLSLQSIEDDYEEYGYLEDYQVEWLLENFKRVCDAVITNHHNHKLNSYIEQKLRGSQYGE